LNSQIDIDNQRLPSGEFHEIPLTAGSFLRKNWISSRVVDHHDDRLHGIDCLNLNLNYLLTINYGIDFISFLRIHFVSAGEKAKGG